MLKTVAKISVGVLLTLALVGSVFIYGVFSAVEVFTPASFSTAVAPTPSVTAKSWLIFDVELGEILYEDNAEEVLPIASITKLFTAADFVKHVELRATTTITWEDTIAEGRAGKLVAGEIYTNRELLFPLLLESSNDAAVAIERIHPTVRQDMNISVDAGPHSGLSFKDTSGLSVANRSSARELAVATRVLYKNQPQIFDITSISSYYSENNGWINNSPFIKDEAYRGGKHGFTYEAGRTSVALFEEQINGGTKRVIGYIILGSEDLSSDMDILRDYMWQNTTYQ